MTTFTTEDRLIAEQNGSVTINVEPIPFAGVITITENLQTACLDCGKKVTADSIHTCSPQLKELTDEEITNLFRAASDHIEFARAILRKAQEK
jgi:ABC-type branched-subunit amino acid transport system ATPase component